MAGDWIKMRCNLGTDPRVLRIAEGLGIPELHVVGLLWRFWSWADQHTTCDAVSVTESLLDRITCDGFALQLKKVGWLEVTGNGIRLPNFDEHNGQTAKQRLLTARRMKRHRDAASVTKASPEKRREEKIYIAEAEASSFDEFWQAYPRRVGPAAARKAFAKLQDKPRVIAAAKSFAAAVAQWKAEDRQFIPHPSTWLNQGRYDDDPTTWQRGGEPERKEQQITWVSAV